DGSLGDWFIDEAFTLVPSGSGYALQTQLEARDIWSGIDFADVAAQARFLLSDGTAIVYARAGNDGGMYSATLSMDGQVRLYRTGVEVAAATTGSFDANTWVTLRLAAVQGEITVAVAGVDLIAYSDPQPLPEGEVGYSVLFTPTPPDQTPPVHVALVDDLLVETTLTETATSATVEVAQALPPQEQPLEVFQSGGQYLPPPTSISLPNGWALWLGDEEYVITGHSDPGYPNGSWVNTGNPDKVTSPPNAWIVGAVSVVVEYNFAGDADMRGAVGSNGNTGANIINAIASPPICSVSYAPPWTGPGYNRTQVCDLLLIPSQYERRFIENTNSGLAAPGQSRTLGGWWQRAQGSWTFALRYIYYGIPLPPTPTPTVTPEPPPLDTICVGTINADEPMVNVRAETGSQAQLLGTLNAGDTVYVTDYAINADPADRPAHYGWFKIHYQSDWGWVWSERVDGCNSSTRQLTFDDQIVSTDENAVLPAPVRVGEGNPFCIVRLIAGRMDCAEQVYDAFYRAYSSPPTLANLLVAIIATEIPPYLTNAEDSLIAAVIVNDYRQKCAGGCTGAQLIEWLASKQAWYAAGQPGYEEVIVLQFTSPELAQVYRSLIAGRLDSTIIWENEIPEDWGNWHFNASPEYQNVLYGDKAVLHCDVVRQYFGEQPDQRAWTDYVFAIVTYEQNGVLGGTTTGSNPSPRPSWVGLRNPGFDAGDYFVGDCPIARP
ncbi:MAG: SH3 domain-containing protein, partial [Anaerolineae bacterium]|nr:SH3 domain-containing protein [Anaerolineae bacterium]